MEIQASVVVFKYIEIFRPLLCTTGVSRSPVVTLKLERDEQELSEGWLRAHGTPQQVVKRCRIVLLED